jgi:type I restriction enzyme S subunit
VLHCNNKTLEQLAETLFRQWFVEEAEDSWEEVKLGSIVQTILGGTPSTEKKEYWNGTIAWINSGEVNKDRIIKPTKFISELGLKNSNTKLLPKKTTVMAITGATMGQVSYLEIETCANQSVVGIIPNELFYPEFLHLLVKNNVEFIIQNETGGAQPHINKNDINNSLIKVPPKEVLKNTKEKLENLYNKISNNCKQIQQLETLRDTLLPKLMNGVVRVEN